MDRLRFGTDGWRDRIGERFTTGNVRRAAQATADEIRVRGGTDVAVARDTRFGGAMFAHAAAETLAANGLTVHLADGPLPTPALSFAVRHLGAAMGVMLTASHNPAEWHGFKLKGPYGGTATQDVYDAVASRVDATGPDEVRRDAGAGRIVPLDVRDPYYDALMKLVDLDALRTLEGTLVHDPMGGAAAGWLVGFARHAGLRITVEEVRGEPDPLFHGGHPEPIRANLGPLIARMERGDALLGVATDGDGDRLGAVLRGGRVADAHEIFALLLDRLQRDGAEGRVVTTVTVARIVEKIALARGLEVRITPVGFKWLVEEMLAGGVLIAGEESGGIGVPDHLPERDGIANALLLLQSVAGALHEAGSDASALRDAEGGPLGVRLAALEEEAEWSHHYDRLDLRLASSDAQAAVLSALDDDRESFAGRAVQAVDRRDGVKFQLDGGAGLMFRASGTEPLLRVYCEAQSADDVRELLRAAQAFVHEVER